MLHIAERLAQLADFIDTSVIRQSLVEMSFGDCAGLMGKLFQRLQLFADDAHKDEQHQQQAEHHDSDDDAFQAGIAAEYVAFRADDGHAPSGIAERPEEYIAVGTVDEELAHTFFSPEHRVSEF